MENAAIARELLRQARVLAAHGENLYRVRAYRRAAAEIIGWNRPIGEIIAESGSDGLMVIPGVGESLSQTIADLARDPNLLASGVA
jgi:DNA polymerase/3'-5' exonuclease PolX